MAGFRMHLGTASVCGVVYGGAAVNPFGYESEEAILAAGLTAVGGMLPDLDSDSGRPIKELFALAGAVVPLLLVPRLNNLQLSHEGMLLFLIFAYLSVRYGAAWLVSRLTVHRGMFHSIPAMFIAGLLVYLEYGSGDRHIRLLLAGGVMVGFLSHLVLDEIYSVDFNGVRVKLKSSAGSALKFFSPSLFGTTVCYLILGLLGTVAYMDYKHHETGGEKAEHMLRREIMGTGK
jgi:LexA-binding, inner membrane-associated putative hydrolase